MNRIVSAAPLEHAPVTSAEAVRTSHFHVDGIHCAACIRRIESALAKMPGVVRARVNLSTRRLRVDWREGDVTPEDVVARVDSLGFKAAPFDPEKLRDDGAAEEKRLLLALAVAGFAAGNVMLLSVSVWSGHGAEMGVGTRTLFHWVSALIALPTVVYSGMPFFRSAARALKARALNMDVPISLAVVLATVMSVQQTMQGAEHAYFDAAVGLLFFLLVGRYLDRRARAKARSAAERLIGLRAATASVIGADGAARTIATTDIESGMLLAVAAGERLAADGVIEDGETELDTSLVTGESLPRPAGVGARVFAGTLNLGQPVRVRVKAAGEDTLLAEIVRLMEAAEQGRARYVRLADRVARFYAPAVHILAAGTFLGWMIVGAGWERSLLTAVAVLIITCPCALGLAVPAVQVVASGRLLQRGILLKSADGLERVAEVDTIVFDKTGTLTLGEPTLVDPEKFAPGVLALAGALAAHSKHPLARAVARAASGKPSVPVADVREVPGSGLSGESGGRRVRLGSRVWCDVAAPMADASAGSEIWLAVEREMPVRFVFTDVLRVDARETIDDLKRLGLAVELLSGDRAPAVRTVAEALGIETWRAECPPDAKVARLRELTASGRQVLMVGDGLNDAPALAAGHASISPAGAADISQTAADLIFQGDRLAPVLEAVRTARAATRHVKQNFALAILYNAVAVPIAIAGLATPLVAAVAMSSSSLIVTLNALRLRWVK